MSEKPMSYAVLLAHPEKAGIQEVAKALAAFQKIHLQDATPKARSAWGIPADNLSKEDAAKLSRLLNENGLESIVLPQGLLEDLPEPAAIESLEFRPNAIEVKLKSGQQQSLAKDQIRLIAAAGLKQIVTTISKVKEGPGPTQRMMSMGLLMVGLPIHVGGRPREVQKKKHTTELFFYLDFCLCNPVRRYRVDAQNFNFSCLKARMGYTAPQNFRILVREMLRLCPQAAKNRGSQVLLDGAPVASMGYDTIADLDRETRWLLTLDSLKNP